MPFQLLEIYLLVDLIYTHFVAGRRVTVIALPLQALAAVC